MSSSATIRRGMCNRLTGSAPRIISNVVRPGRVTALIRRVSTAMLTTCVEHQKLSFIIIIFY